MVYDEKYDDYEIKKTRRKSLFIDRTGTINFLFIVTFITIILFGTLIYSAFNPYYESMYCNENLSCKVEHKYIGNIGYSENFKISSNSYIDFQLGLFCLFHSPPKRRGPEVHIKHIYYNLYDNGIKKNPFKRYVASLDMKNPEKLTLNTNVEKVKFENYIHNPSLCYLFEVSSLNDIFYFGFWMFLLAWPIMVLIEIIYRNK